MIHRLQPLVLVGTLPSLGTPLVTWTRLTFNQEFTGDVWGHQKVSGHKVVDIPTEPAMLVPEVAKQHEEFVRAIAFGGLVSARASF